MNTNKTKQNKTTYKQYYIYNHKTNNKHPNTINDNNEVHTNKHTKPKHNKHTQQQTTHNTTSNINRQKKHTTQIQCATRQTKHNKTFRHM